MNGTEPDRVPAAPIYTITLTTMGTARVDGEEVHIPAGGDPRVAALAEVRIKAAFHGRPVRVIAKEPDGAIWPLIVAVDGTVTTVSSHPTPPPPPPAPCPTPPTPATAPSPQPRLPAAPQPNPETPAAGPTPIPGPAPAPPAANPGTPAPAAPPGPEPAYALLSPPGTPHAGQPLPPWEHTRPSAPLYPPPPAPVAAPPAPQPAPGPAAPQVPASTAGAVRETAPAAPAPETDDPSTTRPLTDTAAPARETEVPDDSEEWTAPPSGPYAPLLDRVRAQEEAGDLEGALVSADLMEAGLASTYGHHHPHTVNALGLRAWLLLRRGTDWAETTELFLLTIERRQEAKAPEDETRRLIANAHFAWRKLTGDDPEYALEVAGRLVDVLGDHKRAKDVIQWIEIGAARN